MSGDCTPDAVVITLVIVRGYTILKLFTLRGVAVTRVFNYGGHFAQVTVSGRVNNLVTSNFNPVLTNVFYAVARS